MPRISVLLPRGASPSESFLHALKRPRVSEVAAFEGAGPAAATGDYLLFLRANDSVVPLGLLSLLASLDASSSDIALGTGGTGPGSVPDLAEPRSGTTPHRLPALLEHNDPSATMWRRTFWAAQGFQWPAEPAHERGFLTRALLRAGSVDVAPEPVTLRQSGYRAGPSTRSLRSTELSSLADRLDDLLGVARALEGTPLRRHWETTVLDPELRLALDHLNEGEPDLRERIVDLAAQILDEAGPDLGSGATAVQRLAYHFARRRLVPHLLEILKAERSGELTSLRPVRRWRKHYGDYPFRDDAALAVPRETYRLDQELNIRARVDEVRWEGDVLHIEGYAHLRRVDVDGPREGSLRLALVRSGHRRHVVRLPVERVHRPDVTADAKEAAFRYDWSGFRTSIDVSALRGRQGWSYGLWRLEATVSGDGTRRSRVVGATRAGNVRHPELHDTGDVRVVTVNGQGRFAVEVDTMPATVTAAEVHDGQLVVSGEVRRRLTATTPSAVLVTRASGSTVLSRDVELVRTGDRHSFSVGLPLDELRAAAADEPGEEGQWTLRIVLPGAPRSVPLRSATGLASVREGGVGAQTEVQIARTPNGRVALTCTPARPVVEQARWDGDVLELSGRWPGDGFEIALVTREAALEHVLSPVISGDRFTLSFSPSAMTSLAGTLPMATGDWLTVVRRAEDPEDSHPLLAEHEVLACLPLERRPGAKSFTLTEDAGNLELQVGPNLADDQRGPANQHRMQTQDFPRFLASGLRDEVLIESYESRAYGDNARAVLEELQRRDTGLRCRWVVVDGQTDLPAGIEPVTRGSRDYYEALARSRYVLVPNYRPLSSWLQTPEDQVLVQTWHGAPYKKIALDNTRGQAFGARAYVEMLKRETARWNYLLSPNPVSTPILRQAFAFEGEMLETGYPRTDVFYSPDREARAAAVREKLRLPGGKKVVLYAPTLRDDHNYGGSRYSLDLRIDLQHARAELGEDHVLLVRRHAKVVDTVLSADGEFARDVSLWPDVNELLLATDVLVTDYSSLMFDFANTRRPMLFFTYDLDDYAGRLRGLYFSPDRMPGPHLPTSEALVAAIRDVDAHHEAHAEKYRTFTEDFCAWDDGGAAARFVDRVFGPSTT